MPSGAFAGGLAAGLGSGWELGLKHQKTKSSLLTEEQDRALAAAEEKRKGIKFGQAQADRAAESAAHRAEAESLYESTGGTAGTSQVENPSVEAGRMNLGGPGQGQKPAADGTGVTIDQNAPTYDVAEGEPTKTRTTTETETETSTPGRGIPVGGAKVDVAYPGGSQISTRQALQIYRQNPNKYTRAIYTRAQAGEVAAAKWRADRLDAQYTNDLKSAQAEGLRANAESTRVKTMIERTKIPAANSEARRKEVEERVRLAGAQVQNLTAGIGLTDGENSGPAALVMANMVQGMNAAQQSLGFTTTAVKQDGGYSIVTSTVNPETGEKEIVGSQMLRTVDDLKKYVAVGGSFAMPEKWNEYQSRASLTQQAGLLESIAAGQVGLDKAKTELGRELTEAELANAGGAAKEIKDLNKLLTTPGALLENEAEIRDKIDLIGRMVPSMVYRTEKYTIKKPDGTEEKGTRRVNTYLERYEQMKPKTKVQHPNRNGQLQEYDMKLVALHMGGNWEETKKKARDYLKLKPGQEPTEEQMDAYVKYEIGGKISDPRAARFLVNLVGRARQEREAAILKMNATPQDSQVQTEQEEAPVAGAGRGFMTKAMQARMNQRGGDTGLLGLGKQLIAPPTGAEDRAARLKAKVAEMFPNGVRDTRGAYNAAAREIAKEDAIINSRKNENMPETR